MAGLGEPHRREAECREGSRITLVAPSQEMACGWGGHWSGPGTRTGQRECGRGSQTRNAATRGLNVDIKPCCSTAYPPPPLRKHRLV